MFNYYMKPVLHFISFSPTLFKANMHSQTVRKRVFCVWFFFIFLLYRIVLVLPYINMHLPRVYTCSPSWTPPPTSLPIPFLWVIPVHQPLGSCILHWTWTGDSFLIWYYTCFNAILSNHPPLPLPQSPKDCSIHLCLFCCLAYTARGWVDLGEWHWNMYNIIYETNCQSRFDAW